MPREAANTPVPHNPFRQNRSAADMRSAGGDARWPPDAARRDPSGSKAVPLPERSAVTAARDVEPPPVPAAPQEAHAAAARAEAAAAREADRSIAAEEAVATPPPSQQQQRQ